jgi:hypothetical protein
MKPQCFSFMMLSRFSSGGLLRRNLTIRAISTHPCYDIWPKIPHRKDYLCRTKIKKLSLNLNNASIDQKHRTWNVCESLSRLWFPSFSYFEIINVNISGIPNGVSNNKYIFHMIFSDIFSYNFHGFLFPHSRMKLFSIWGESMSCVTLENEFRWTFSSSKYFHQSNSISIVTSFMLLPTPFFFCCVHKFLVVSFHMQSRIQISFPG